MFFGSIPPKLIQSAVKMMGVERWAKVNVCCSGTFRVEAAIRSQNGNCIISGNDVSIFTVPLGRYLIGAPVNVKIGGELDFLNGAIERAGGGDDAVVAAIIVGQLYARFATGKDHRYKAAIRKNTRDNVDEILADEIRKVRDLKERTQLNGFFEGDWREHARNAIASGTPFFASPPFRKGDYERMYRFMGDNVEWDAPSYDLWDPAQLPDLIREFEESGVPFCLWSNQHIRTDSLRGAFQSGWSQPFFLYARRNFGKKSVLLIKREKWERCRFEPVDPWEITEKSRIEIVRIKAQHANYIRHLFLAPNIKLGRAGLNYAVMIDGKVAGILAYNSSVRYGGQLRKADVKRDRRAHYVYLLADTAVSRERKLSKLIAMLGLCKEAVEDVKRTYILDVKYVGTSAWSQKPVSMKYRGIYKLIRRTRYPSGKQNLYYEGEYKGERAKTIFKRWFKKYASKEKRNEQD